MKKQQLCGYIVFCCLILGGIFESGAQIHTYFYVGNNGGVGSGTPEDPYDASGEHFDPGLAAQLPAGPDGIIVHLAPGTYYTAGNTLSSLYEGVSIVGSGSLNTEIKLNVAPASLGEKTMLYLSGDVALKSIKLNCNSTDWPTVRAKYNGVGLASGSLVADDLVITNLRGDYAAGLEGFGFSVNHTSVSKPSSFNNIRVLEIQADVEGTPANRAYVSPLACGNYTDQYVYINDLHIDTGANRAACAFSPYGRNYIVRNVSNTGMLGAGMWADADHSGAPTVENVTWIGGKIVARYAIAFGVALSTAHLKVSNVTVTDVECDHGPVGATAASEDVDGILLWGDGVEVDGLFVNRLKCSWPAVSLPYSTSTFPYWHMGSITVNGVMSAKNIVIQDSVFIPAHTASRDLLHRNWVVVSGAAITPPTLINCRDR